MKIVAFDLGRTFAWATNASRKWRCGHAQLDELRTHRLGSFLRCLQGDLIEIKQGEIRWALPPGLIAEVDVVVYETPFVRGRFATRSLWGMAGVLEACASAAGKPVLDVSIATIKKFATGRGDAPKNAMVAAARRLGYRGRQPDEADAFCLLKYAEKHLERAA